MQCPHCQSEKLRKDGFSSGRQMYKCLDCGRKHKVGVRQRAFKTPKVLHPCLRCGVLTKNKQFCSHSCASTHSNLNHPERYEERRANRLIRTCKYCGVQVDGRRVTCTSCNRNIVDWEEIKLSEIQNSAKYQISAQVRSRARYTYRNSDRPKHCINCGYNKHYEVCHIRAIYDFPLDTTIATINDLSNLVALCPNCHWEFDHNMLSLEEIRAKNNANL
jgi:hypothetical protein